MRKFSSKCHLLKTLLLNTRLNDYQFFLAEAKQQGYDILPLCEFYNLMDRRKGKHMVLRHDVDWMGVSTRKMFEIEKLNGLRSTYYFRFSTIDKPLIDEMIDAGFEVGLHYETIADIIREQKLTSKEQIDLDYARNRFRADVIRFEEIIGHKIKSCCSHGTVDNVRLGISNNCITDGIPMSVFGLQFEAYDQQMYEKDVDCHIMDCSLLFNYGFAYKDTPITSIDNDYQNIIFLSHPNHWWKKMTFNERIKPLILMMLGRAKYDTNRTFRRIAK